MADDDRKYFADKMTELKGHAGVVDAKSLTFGSRAFWAIQISLDDGRRHGAKASSFQDAFDTIIGWLKERDNG